MFGLSGVFTILGAVVTRKKLEQLELKEDPNMPFLYWLAVMGAMLKPKWTSSKSWPALKVRAGAISADGANRAGGAPQRARRGGSARMPARVLP
jgi:hypothetical protein